MAAFASARLPPWTAALLSVVVVSFFAATRPAPLTEFDQPFYVGIAADLRHLGRFTNGFAFDDAGPDRTRQPGMRFAPLYPAALSLAASLDPAFGREIDCVARTRAKDASCGHDATLVRFAQAILLIGFFHLVWVMGRLLRPMTPRVAWLALLIVLPTAPLLLRYVSYVMTEITALVFFTAACAAGLAAARNEGREAPWLFASGCLFGMTALTRPAFLYLCEVLAFCAAIAVVGPRRRNRIAGASSLILGMMLTVGPWMLRNAVVLGRFALTRGYDSHTLVQRIAFDAMSSHELGKSFVCWLPDGNGLGNLVFGSDACVRFGWDERPDTFYSIGNGSLMEGTLAAAGGWDHHLAYLVSHYIAADPVKHVAVTLSLALRGAWIDHYWGLVLFPLCLWSVVRDLRYRDWSYPALASPALFMLILNAAIAVNQVRYNLVLIPTEALAGALLIDRILSRHFEVMGKTRIGISGASCRSRSTGPAASPGCTLQLCADDEKIGSRPTPAPH